MTKTTASADATPLVPNHHAHHPGFAGAKGLLAACTMVLGRRGVARLAVELTGVTSSDHVVDVGCGPGRAAREAKARGASVAAIDPASVMLTVARVIPGSRGVRWTEGTAESLPVSDEAASVLWSLSAVHHWQDVDAGVAEAYRVLRPGGRLLAIEPRTVPGATGLASHGWTDEQAAMFAEVCANAGFANPRIERRTVDRGPVLAVLADRA